MKYVNDIRADMERLSLKHGGESLHQYYNTPSCNGLDKEPPFAERLNNMIDALRSITF